MMPNSVDAAILAPFAFIAILIVAYLFFRGKVGGSILTSATPILSGFSRDLTEAAKHKELDPVIGRGQEISRLTMVLSKRTKNNAVLIGEPGVGKTTVVEGLAQNIANRTVPSELYDKRVLALDLNSLLAGTKYRGEFEGRVKRITEEITASKRSIVLFIDEIHNLIDAESSGESISIGDIFKPAMARGELQIIGATTQEEYDTYFSKDLAFKRRLQPIYVKEPDREETFRILQGIRSRYEDYHRVRVSDEALRACIEQSAEMLPGRSFPDKAIDLMDEASSKSRLECVAGPNSVAVTDVDIEDIRSIAAGYREVES